LKKKAIKKLRHPLRLLILKGKVRTPEEYERLKKLKHEELFQMLH
jgi:hypothetical protein